MASVMNSISLPHGTIPTQMFGNVNLQNAIMYVNENFAEVKDGFNDAASAVNEALEAKADADHDHAETYAEKSHTHAQSEIIGLSSALDGKAESNHEHTQYLTSMPAHYHATSDVQGLDERLQAKAESVHTHKMSDVEGLTTQLGTKASTNYVDTQIQTVGSSIKTIADQEVLEYKADNEDGSSEEEGDIPEDSSIAPENETTAQKNARVGDDEKWARADHKHVIVTETDASKLSSLKADGTGTDGAAAFGTSTKVPRLDHAHPLNVATSGTPADVVKSDGTASLGSENTYARTDHVHKMPSLAATDISYGSSTVGAKLDNHETRIDALEDAPTPTAPVTSVNNKTGAVVLDADDVGALDEDDIGSTVQAHSAKLTSLNTALSSDGKVPLSQLTGNITGHTGTCYVTIGNDGTLGHSGNAAYNLLNNAANDASGERGANKLITDLDVGNGIETDASTHNIKVKAKENGGITVDSDGVALGGLSGTGFVKSESGTLSVPQEQPIALPSGSGALYSNGSAVSTKSIGDGSSYDIASGDHSHAYGSASLTGFGTAAEKNVDFFAVKATEATAASALAAAGDAQDAADAAQETADSKIDKTTADGYYQPKDAVLTAIADGGLYDTTDGGHDVTSNAHYIATTSSRARLLGIAANASAVTARDAIGTDMVTYDGENALDDIIDSNGKIDSSNVTIEGASQGEWVKIGASGELVSSDESVVSYDADDPPTSASIVSMDANGQLSDECALPTSASSTEDKVLTIKKNGTALSWENPVGSMGTAVDNSGANIRDTSTDTPSTSFTNWTAGSGNGVKLRLYALTEYNSGYGAHLFFPIDIEITANGNVKSITRPTGANGIFIGA